ncbi:uncharacterized protein [Haliotis cracherodii]|uniref:uncharacterized protein n=1 Tax=Haliotis cracherodii TaxID=6455 RepID=UPI0039E9DC0A
MALGRWFLCCFLFGIFVETFAVETETYYLDEICGNTIDMQALGIESGRLLLRRPEIGLVNFNCVIFIRAPDPRRLIIKVTGLDIVAPFGCARDYIQFFDGATSANPLSNAICGYTTPDVAFITTQPSASMVFAKKLDYMNDQFEVVFTAYKKGPCDPDEYNCHNGLCIADHLYCDGFDNCGDGSDLCLISIGGIVGIAIAVAIILILVALVVALLVQRRRRQKLEKWHRLHNTYSFNGSSTMSLPLSRLDYSLPRSIKSFREVSLSGSGKDYDVPVSQEDLYASIMKDKEHHKLHILNASSLPRDTHSLATGSFGHVVSFRCYPAPVPRMDEEFHRATPQPDVLSHGFFFGNSADNDSTDLKSAGEGKTISRHHSSRSTHSSVPRNPLQRNHQVMTEIPTHYANKLGHTAGQTEEQMVELDMRMDGLKDGRDIYFHNDTTALKTDRGARGSFDLVRL